MLEAFSQLRFKYPMIQLWIVGCELRESYPGVTSVVFESDKDRMHNIFMESDVFVLPSIAEPFGYVYLEAMSCGLPCIGTNTGGVPDIIIDNETGFIVRQNDVAALRDKLELLIRDPDLAFRFGTAGLSRCKEFYQWDYVAMRIADSIKAMSVTPK
jgi:glycosyltransferase involved in cell wall biosynthesis